MSETPSSPLRQRMIDDMRVRKFGKKTQNDNIRHAKTFSTFLGRSPALATADDLRRLDFTGLPLLDEAEAAGKPHVDLGM